MGRTGGREVRSAPRHQVASTLDHFNPFGGPPEQKPFSSSYLRSLAKRFAPAPKSPTQTPSPPASSIFSLSLDISNEAGSRSRRPRHVEVAIPHNVIASILREQPPSVRSSEPVALPTPKTTPRLIYDLIKEETLPITDISSRPKYRRIVIPAFAQPHGLFPPTPPSSAESTPRASKVPQHFCGATHDMSRPNTSGSRTSTLDSNASVYSPNQSHDARFQQSSSTFLGGINSSSDSSLSQEGPTQGAQLSADHNARALRVNEGPPRSADPSPVISHNTSNSNGTTNLSGLVCNVHKCTGQEPHALVGATTTILGDKLYVFGGRLLSRRRVRLTSDLHELDLVRRHWTKVETTGDTPLPRYFHSVCALGDTKLICYGGMSPSPVQPPNGGAQRQGTAMAEQPEMNVMSDIHIYDASTRHWTHVANTETPQGRYAHCAAVLPSTATFTSANAPLSAIHHNPPSSIPNQGTLGVALDGNGGAEMVVVGGQDSANNYIEQISVFNLRSLKWTNTSSLGKSCGAYRSVVAPLTSMSASKIGMGSDAEVNGDSGHSDKAEPDPSMLIYSNYNFLNVKLELQIRLKDGSLVEKPMTGQFSPPGLRFPNGGMLDNHFVVSGFYLTSTKQEYALWALDLRTLTWSRIDAGGGIFTQGSWNRGVLWPRRNSFVILGNRKRSSVEDYNHRRTNFSNICIVELEAFGLYDNPRRAWSTSNYPSVSAPVLPPSVVLKTGMPSNRYLPKAAVDLGLMALDRGLADMDLIAIGGERCPVNSHLLSRRWGPFFVQLLRDSMNATATSIQNDASSSSDGGTLRPGHLNPSSVTSRNSSITITPSITTAASIAPSSITATSSNTQSSTTSKSLDPPTPHSMPPSSRPRQLYLPHTPLTIRALRVYLYTSSLPLPGDALCTPQILCSLLQLARPYRVDGLLEATIERLHQILDARNAAAICNAAAMAAGGGRGTGVNFSKEGEPEINEDIAQTGLNNTRRRFDAPVTTSRNDESDSEVDTGSEVSGSDISSSAASESENDVVETNGTTGRRVAVGPEEIWSGGVSSVVGLQKRGLRGLMEGRRARQGPGRGGSGGTAAALSMAAANIGINGSSNEHSVGLGIA
ncbi:hypothetical protein ACLMJK_006088 [Lecanora helva]